jgi:integrase
VLPLPADVGEAIAGYLVKARPPSASRHVFTVVVAPFRGMGASTVTQLVQRACERAGVPSFGPHGMRHAAAGAGPGHIAKPGTLRAQLGRQVPVITGLEQQRQHRGIQRAVSHSVLVELAHRGQDVVDPARAPDPALPGAGPARSRPGRPGWS